MSFVPVNEPLLDGNEKQYLIDCIETGWVSSEGPYVSEFEELFAKRVGRTYAIAVSSGTAALDIAVESLEIGHGDEVIVPTFTIISCIHQIVRSGAIPVFVDCDPRTWNIDVAQIESKITSRTRAIMVVHIYGLPVDMDPLLSIAARYGLRIIEDAAEMHGQEYRGRACGSFGDVSAFSFYPNKHITTGEGGMVVTDDESIATACRELRNLCFNNERRFVHYRLGWNYRMTNLQAALGIAQLERLDEFVARKRRIGATYSELLSDIESIQLPLAETDSATNIYWVYGIVIEPHAHINAARAMSRLSEQGIGSRPFFFPLHLQPVLSSTIRESTGSLPIAERLGEYGLYLPSGLALKESQMERVACAVKSIFS